MRLSYIFVQQVKEHDNYYSVRIIDEDIRIIYSYYIVKECLLMYLNEPYKEKKINYWRQKKLIVFICCSKLPAEKLNFWQTKINNIAFNYIPKLSFYFVNFPLKVLSVLFGIGFEVYFLGFFLNSKSIKSEIKLLAFWFNLVVVLIIFFLSGNCSKVAKAD